MLGSLFKSVANFLGSCVLVVPFGSAIKHCATAPDVKILLSFQTVIPLNETTGIIEWINNLQPLRAILLKLYKEKQGKNIVRNEEIRSVKFGLSNSGVGCCSKGCLVLRSAALLHGTFFKKKIALQFYDGPVFVLRPSTKGQAVT